MLFNKTLITHPVMLKLTQFCISKYDNTEIKPITNLKTTLYEIPHVVEIKKP